MSRAEVHSHPTPPRPKAVVPTGRTIPATPRQATPVTSSRQPGSHEGGCDRKEIAAEPDEVPRRNAGRGHEPLVEGDGLYADRAGRHAARSQGSSQFESCGVPEVFPGCFVGLSLPMPGRGKRATSKPLRRLSPSPITNRMAQSRGEIFCHTGGILNVLLYIKQGGRASQTRPPQIKQQTARYSSGSH